MADIGIYMSKPVSKLDGSLSKKVMTFIQKLTTDDTAPGLHIEPIKNAPDPRVRTGRVDQQYRAVLFKLSTDAGTTYVLHGVWNHDDAYEVAGTTTLRINPTNGVPEFLQVTEDQVAVTPPKPVVGPPVPVAEPAPVVESVVEPKLLDLGLDPEVLVSELGFDPELAAQVAGCRTEDELLRLAGAYEDSWQGLVIIDLGSGLPVAEIKERLGMERPDEGAGSDQDIVDALNRPAAEATFTYVDNDEDLRRIIETGDFGAWRVWLHPEQRRYAENDYNGPFRLSGGAGTGKTVVLLHRTRRLAETDPQARIVLTTYTRNLADVLERDLNRLDPSVSHASALGQPGAYVKGIDALAAAVLQSAGADIAAAVERVLGAASTKVHKRTRTPEAWDDALFAADVDLPTELRSANFLQQEYEDVVLPNLITERAEYLKVRRPGRGVRLGRAQRAAVWEVIAAYRARARVDGTLDFAEAATVAAAHLDLQAEAGQARPADHVLVDEGQDMSPARWQLLRALVAEGPNDLFIAEDSYQRIYGSKVVLGHYGIRIVGRSRKLTLNYRTTAQNLHFAVSVLEGGAYEDLEEADETTTGYHSARSGPKPEERHFTSYTQELEAAAELLRAWTAEAGAAGMGAETIAILVRDRFQRDRVVAGLNERGVEVRSIDKEEVRPGAPVVMTMHRAKGTEFSRVLLFEISEKSIPMAVKNYQWSEEQMQDALLRERSLLYVAATRARDQLVVMWSGEASELLPSSQLGTNYSRE